MATEIKILIVDDEPAILRLFQRKLEMAGYKVFTASNGRDGFATAKEQLPNIVITDWNMPEVDGVGLCRQLRADEQTKNTPIIFVTGRGHQFASEAHTDLNLSAILQKPILNLQELLVAVQRILQKMQDEV